MIRQIGFAMLLTSVLLSLARPTVAVVASAAVDDFPATELNIFSADGKQLVGHGSYSLSRTDDTELLRGENQYLNGEHDIELDRLQAGDDEKAPKLLSYERSFFDANGSLQVKSVLDVEQGKASCNARINGNTEVRQADLAVPADTYAGATQLMFLVIRLRQGAQDIKFHAFNCIPGPKIIAVDASSRTDQVSWSMYPGELVRLEVQPDFGWLSFILDPFVPKIYAWFDPGHNWNYVGGIYDRFYKGPHIMTVRTSHAFEPK